jgi:hypothetical protein
MAKRATNEGLQENRTRVTVFLPCQKTEAIRAIRVIIGYLEDQRHNRDCRVTGYTASEYPDAPFSGAWWSARQRKWIREKVTIVVIDYEKLMKDETLEQSLCQLKQAIIDSYKRFNHKQDAIWMTASSVMRFT